MLSYPYEDEDILDRSDASWDLSSDEDVDSGSDLHFFNNKKALRFFTSNQTNYKLVPEKIRIEKKANHVSLPIRGINVLFPYKPCDPQIEYMGQVIDALNGKKNALLQSPTGTGKTLCLLCAILAWASHNENGLGKKIYYATRTISQMKQVFEQLKNTSYRPITTSLCSRDHCCVKFKEEKLNSSDLSCRCQKARAGQSGSCEEYDNLIQNEIKLVLKYQHELLDIEDLKKEGKQHGFCPYYLERKKLEVSHLVFMPYNYLMNRSIRKNTKIDVENSIIIFDEAHNIEKMAEESATYEFSLRNLTQCKDILDKFRNYSNRSMHVENHKNRSKQDQIQSAAIGLEYPINCLQHCLSQLLMKIKNSKDKYKLSEGREIFRYFKEGTQGLPLNNFLSKNEGLFNNGIDESNFKVFFTILLKTLPPNPQNKMPLEDLELLQKKSPICFQKISKQKEVIILRILCLKRPEGFQEDIFLNPIESYKLLFQPEEYGNSRSSAFDLKIKLLCVNPGIGFSFLRGEQKKPHSLILTSETISPFSSVEEELMIKFPVQFENEHIINTKTQCKTFIVQNGKNNSEITFSYKMQNDKMFSNAVDIAKNVPNGVVVCFATKSMMKNCLSSWQNNKEQTYDQLSLQKELFEELEAPEKLDELVEKYKTAAKENGAILFCYCRGRVSEGIDFSNEMARGVVIIGIPLPPCFDSQLVA